MIVQLAVCWRGQDGTFWPLLQTANCTIMTNNYCMYTVLRYSWWWTVNLSETCRVLYQINLRNSASRRLLLLESKGRVYILYTFIWTFYVKVYTFYYKWDCRITTKLLYENQPKIYEFKAKFQWILKYIDNIHFKRPLAILHF